MKINGIEKSTASLQAYESIFENLDRFKRPIFLSSYFLFFAFIFLFVSDFFLVQFFSRVYWILTCNNLFTCVFTCVLFQDFIISLTCVLFVKKCSLLEGEATLPSPVK